MEVREHKAAWKTYQRFKNDKTYQEYKELMKKMKDIVEKFKTKEWTEFGKKWRGIGEVIKTIFCYTEDNEERKREAERSIKR